MTGKPPAEFFGAWRDEFSSSGWRRCANVSDEIGYGDIALMADRRDNGVRTVDNRVRDGLQIERPEIFERATPTRDQNNICGGLRGASQRC